MTKGRPLGARSLILAVGVAALGLSGRAVPALEQLPDARSREAALQLFEQRAEGYAMLHRHLEAQLPPLVTTRDVLRNTIVRQLLAGAIRKARGGVQQGAIFSHDVDIAFRVLIGDTLHGRDVERILREQYEEHPDIEGVWPVVNERLPEGAMHDMPVALLFCLPVLPEEIEYRIVDRHLVLWDVDADLVIDYLPNALGVVETSHVE